MMIGVPTNPVVVCFGTRPQVIKASVLLTELEKRVPTVAVDTGQHYDFELNALLYEQLGVGRPERHLEVGSGTHGAQTALVLSRIEPLLVGWRPRAVVVIGDTNSTLGCALAAAKLRIPVVHVESGLRAADAMLAEEINRRAVDAMSVLLCAPSALAAERLQKEQLAGRVVVTGDIARDVLKRHEPILPLARDAAPGLLKPDARFVFATLHRAELVDNPTQFDLALAALGRLGMTVLFPLHPRTRRTIEEHGLSASRYPGIHFLPPLGYLQSVACVREASVVVTDSGGVQREAYWLGVPCVTLRSETEWHETVGCGANVLVSPTTPERLAGSVDQQAESRRSWNRGLLGSGDAAARTADLIHELWARSGA